ncbi:MAG: hypothetical protein ACI8PZ_002393 [Myxococcota bacterium]
MTLRRLRRPPGLLWVAIIAILGCGAPADGPVAGQTPLDGTGQTSASTETMPQARTPTPGRVTLHRLNRAEYDNTVRDLLGTPLRPAHDFPQDDFGFGFDNIADTLSMSPLHIEMYELAARELVGWALGPGPVPPVRYRVQAESEDAEASTGGPAGSYWNLWSNGDLTAWVDVAHSGAYTLSVRAYGQQAGPDPVRMAVLVDGAEVAVVDVLSEVDAPETVAVDVDVTVGLHSIGARFLNDYYNPPSEDRNLVIDWVELEGPWGLDGEPEGDPTAILVCDPEYQGEDPCARTIAADFGGRAWRRPVTPDEVERLMGLYALSRDTGGTWLEGVGLMAQAILVAPQFLFRVEADPDPGAGVRALDDWELASRLSYFLWSSMPDAELFALAVEGRLTDDAVLEAQVRRMLDDPRASALVDNLAGQWLYIRAVDELQPDPERFPAFDDELRESMRVQMWHQAHGILLDDRSMLDLVTDPQTMIDARLADHLGVPAPAGEGFQPVSLAGTGRVGLLGTPGLLAALAYPTRTSPVRRGKWVLSNLLCEAPAPPPPGVEALPEDGTAADLSLREQMEQHRADPVCASCHQVMDPIGFGLEHFDATGAWRDQDALGLPIDASGVLPDGQSFDGLVELSGIVASDRKLPACIVQKTFTYATGRAPTVEDLTYLDVIEDRFASGEHRFSELALGIVLSEPFRQRAEEGE